MPEYALTDPRVTYHRNGVSGVGFHLVTFRHGADRLMAVVFDADEPGRECYTAVLAVDNLYAHDGPLAMFDPNAIRKFRGDYFDADLLRLIREATERYDKAMDDKYAKENAR
jgi:hypothetical protein